MLRFAVSQYSKQTLWKRAARPKSLPTLGSVWQSFSTQEKNPSSSTATINGTQVKPDDTGTTSPTAASSATESPYPPDNREKILQYHRFTDIYLGGLWNRLESELGKYESSTTNFDYDVQLTSGCMRVNLPDDAQVIICKDPVEQELKIESNLHTVYGGDSTSDGADPREEASFTFVEEEGEFVSDQGHGVALHQFLEDHLAKHLKVELDLEPQPGPHDKVYGADPT